MDWRSQIFRCSTTPRWNRSIRRSETCLHCALADGRSPSTARRRWPFLRKTRAHSSSITATSRCRCAWSSRQLKTRPAMIPCWAASTTARKIARRASSTAPGTWPMFSAPVCMPSVTANSQQRRMGPSSHRRRARCWRARRWPVNSMATMVRLRPWSAGALTSIASCMPN